MLDMLDLIEAANLPPAIFRTAVRLARMTCNGAPARMSHEDAAEICGTTSDNTVRGHLATLHRAGLFSYRRNAAVTVWWTGAAASSADTADDAADADRRAVDDQIDRPARDLIAQRSPDDESVICGRAIRAVDDHEAYDAADQRAVDDQIDRLARDSRVHRANRAPGDQPNTGFKANDRLGRQAGQPSLPAGGSVRGEPPEPPEPEGAPGQDEQRRSIDLLTDDEVGIDSDMARELAAAYPFEEIRRQIFRLRRDMATGSVRSPGVLRTRLREGFAASVTKADRTSSLWRRHETEQDREAIRRSKYAPAEYGHIIIH